MKRKISQEPCQSKKVKILQNIILPDLPQAEVVPGPETDTSASVGSFDQNLTPLSTILPDLPQTEVVSGPETDTSDSVGSFDQNLTPVSTQTPQKLSSSSPRKHKLKKEIKALKEYCSDIDQQVDTYKGKLNTQREEVLNSITLKEFTSLTYKFCPDRSDLAKFINVQLSQLCKKPKGRFSEKFKTECLAMYLTSPRLYKTKLVKIFCLPHQIYYLNL